MDIVGIFLLVFFFYGLPLYANYNLVSVYKEADGKKHWLDIMIVYCPIFNFVFTCCLAYTLIRDLFN